MELAKLGSYSAAARKVYISSPGIARSVKDLEKELELKLTEPNGKATKLTPDGETIYEKAIDILEKVDDLTAVAQSLHMKEKNETLLSIAIAESPYRGIIVKDSMISSLVDRNGNVALQVFRCSSGECLSALDEGSIEAAVVIGPVEREWAYSSKLYTLPVRATVSKTHPLASHSGSSINDILAFPIARPYDLRYCYPIIAKELDRADEAPRFFDLPPLIKNHRDFLHNDSGIIFMAGKAPPILEPEIVFIELIGFDMRIPISFTHRKDRNNPAIISLKDRLSGVV